VGITRGAYEKCHRATPIWNPILAAHDVTADKSSKQKRLERGGIAAYPPRVFLPRFVATFRRRLYHLFLSDDGWGLEGGRKYGYGKVKGPGFFRASGFAEDNNVSTHAPRASRRCRAGVERKHVCIHRVLQATGSQCRFLSGRYRYISISRAKAKML